ncbi:hypothetical protein ACJX0J_037007, partial [Zea mays]
ILDEIEANDYDNFTRRAYVPKTKKLMALPKAYLRSLNVRNTNKPMDTFVKKVTELNRKMNEVDEESKQVSYPVIRDDNGNDKLDCPALGKQFAAEEISAQNVRNTNMPMDTFVKKVTELNLYLVLLPLDGQSVPKLEKPYHSCLPTLSIRHLCQVTANASSAYPKNIEYPRGGGVVVDVPLTDSSSATVEEISQPNPKDGSPGAASAIPETDLPEIAQVIRSCRDGIHKVVELLQHKFPNVSKTQLNRKVREISDFVDNHWKVKKEVLDKLGLDSSPLCSLLVGHGCKFLDKAAVETADDKSRRRPASAWCLCTVKQVEELKCVLRLLPVWASDIVFAAAYTQMTTTFVLQGDTLDPHVGGGFRVPAAALSVFDTLSVMLWVPLYDRLVVPLARRATGHRRGFTQLARMGAGLLVLAVAMLAAGAME